MSELPEITELLAQALVEIAQSPDERELDNVRIRYLGKKGEVTQQLKRLGSLPEEARPAAGQAINEAKQQLQEALDRRRGELQQERLAQRLARERIDITLPGRGPAQWRAAPGHADPAGNRAPVRGNRVYRRGRSRDRG